jgi:hypothetical protein
VYARLSQIDELTRVDHWYLEDGDQCWYLGEYTARKGYAGSETNNLILNLKKPMDRRERPEWRYKERAIATIATDLRSILGQRVIEGMTFVPMPPSKAKSDPLYDDRIVKILRQMGAGWRLDLRELLSMRQSMAASHTADQRPTPQELYTNVVIDEDVAALAPTDIMIVDDVLTTGAHFKAAQRRLCERFPGVRTFGLFVARRVPETDDFSVFFDAL